MARRLCPAGVPEMVVKAAVDEVKLSAFRPAINPDTYVWFTVVCACTTTAAEVAASTNAAAVANREGMSWIYERREEEGRERRSVGFAL